MILVEDFQVKGKSFTLLASKSWIVKLHNTIKTELLHNTEKSSSHNGKYLTTTHS